MIRTRFMSRMARIGLTAFAITVIFAATATAQKTAPVTVTNTDANPVPVRGGVSVTNTPTVDARQSGDWTVGISGTPTVKLDPSTPVVVSNADDPARQWTSFNLITNERSYTPHSGKTLVLEYVSGVITLGTQYGTPTLRCTSIGIVLPKMSRPSGATDTTWYFSEMVRGYADQTNPVNCDTDFVNVTQFIFTLKGHFVNGLREQP